MWRLPLSRHPTHDSWVQLVCRSVMVSATVVGAGNMAVLNGGGTSATGSSSIQCGHDNPHRQPPPQTRNHREAAPWCHRLRRHLQGIGTVGAIQSVLSARQHPGAQFVRTHSAERRGCVAGAEGFPVANMRGIKKDRSGRTLRMTKQAVFPAARQQDGSGEGTGGACGTSIWRQCVAWLAREQFGRLSKACIVLTNHWGNSSSLTQANGD